MKKTVVLGASLNKQSYSNLALYRLAENQIDAVGIGLKPGIEWGIQILTGNPPLENVHTVTLYLSPKRQEPVEDYIISLRPKRVIFNPGTENPDFYKRLKLSGIQATNACTLVLLATDQY